MVEPGKKPMRRRAALTIGRQPVERHVVGADRLDLQRADSRGAAALAVASRCWREMSIGT